MIHDRCVDGLLRLRLLDGAGALHRSELTVRDRSA